MLLSISDKSLLSQEFHSNFNQKHWILPLFCLPFAFLKASKDSFLMLFLRISSSSIWLSNVYEGFYFYHFKSKSWRIPYDDVRTSILERFRRLNIIKIFYEYINNIPAHWVFLFIIPVSLSESVYFYECLIPDAEYGFTNYVEFSFLLSATDAFSYLSFLLREKLYRILLFFCQGD